MPRCGCAADQCSCHFVAGDGTTVTGTGTAANPYVITAISPAAAGGGGGTRFSGEIVAYGGAVAPTGWLICNGAALSRTVYAALFAVVGVAYGAGDGSTTFNLPNLSAKFPIGASGTYPRGQAGGTNGVTLTTANLPAHTHTINHDHGSITTPATEGTHTHLIDLALSTGTSGVNLPTASTVFDRTSGSMFSSVSGSHTHSVNLPNFAGDSGSTGSGTPVTFVPPYQSVNYIIKT